MSILNDFIALIVTDPVNAKTHSEVILHNLDFLERKSMAEQSREYVAEQVKQQETGW